VRREFTGKGISQVLPGELTTRFRGFGDTLAQVDAQPGKSRRRSAPVSAGPASAFATARV
jgi:hypothetical protein